ncbi:MAG: carbohydrate ABC transporter substrate-binding protein [Clostridiales bacterium]|nr:carbohydrate ABC transporter substrate-binding protein [Clostridiales bacterium]
MKRLKALAIVLAVSMLQPLLMSCSANNRDAVVKEDDPWYESIRFELDQEQLPTEMIQGSVVSYSNGRIYNIYSLINLTDFDNYRRTLLDTYDEQGNLLSRTRLSDPSNYSLNNIQGFKPDSEGRTAEAIAEVFAPGSFETALVTIDLTTGETSDVRLFKDKEGKTLAVSLGGQDTVGVSEVFVAGEYYIPVIYDFSNSSGTAAHAYGYRGSEYLCEFDFSTLPAVYALEEFSYDTSSKTVFTVGSTHDGPLVLEFDPETGRLVSSADYNSQSADEVNIADFKPVVSGSLCKIDTLGNITTMDLQEQEAKTVIDNNWYSPYFSDLSGDVKLIDCDGNGAVIYTQNTTTYSIMFSGVNGCVTILKKADKNPHAGKKIIEIAPPIDKEMTEYLSNAIYEFNRTDDEYFIRVWSKYKTGIKAGRDLSILNADDEKLYTMIQELNGSEAPDIAIGIQKNYAMRDDVFEDLTGYLDGEVLEKQFTNIIEASKIDGKLYFLPVTLEIEGLVTDTGLIAPGAVGITFEDYEKMIEQDLDGFSPYDYPMSEYNYKLDFILSCIDTKSAIEGDAVDFGTDQFYAAVEWSDKLFVQDGFNKALDFDWNEELTKARTGCRYERIDTYLDFIYACKSSEGSYTIIGTPSVDASGPRFRAIETISVTSSSDMKEGAKKFINFLFGGAGFNDYSEEFQNIVTNKEIMARNISIISTKNNNAYASDMAISELMPGILEEDAHMFGFKTATSDMEEQMMASLASISIYYYEDPVINSFLVEEISPYFAGDRSLDDTVKILNDRANKYIKEM